MPTVRYHALLCRDAAGGYSAVALDGGPTGFGASANDARDDLKEYLRWAHRKQPWLPVPDFTDPELRWFTVTIRPEYKDEKRLYPSDAEVQVRVPCVVGTRKSGGSPAASFPCSTNGVTVASRRFQSNRKAPSSTRPPLAFSTSAMIRSRTFSWNQPLRITRTAAMAHAATTISNPNKTCSRKRPNFLI